MKRPPENGRMPGPVTRAFSKSVNATTKAKGTKELSHIEEADIRFEQAEAGIARVAIGLEPVDHLPSYVRLIQVGRWHLKAVA